MMINYNINFKNNRININDTSRYAELKDKIVLLGINTYKADGYPMYNEDIHYTPKNKSYIGRSIKDSYGGTNVIFNEFLPPLNIDVSLCDTSDHEQIEAEIAKGCQVLYLETPTNPTIKITNIKKLSEIAKGVGAIVVVDNTFATPINQNPLALGADIVLHSASKYLGGHADALGGVICGSKKLVDQVYHYREINVATLAPMDAYSLLRGMKTLKLRVERQNENALKIAKFLANHPIVEQVNYPGLETHPGHEIAKNQMNGGYGGMLSFSVKGGLEAIKVFLPKLKYAHMAANLGCVETVVGPPLTTSHVECSAEERMAAGIPEGLVRYSTGIEDVEDLIEDLDQALKGTTDNVENINNYFDLSKIK